MKPTLWAVVPMAILFQGALARGKMKTETCTVSDGGVPAGKVTFQVPRPEGMDFVAGKNGCNLWEGGDPKRPDLAIHIMAVTRGDAGPEQLLNREPDGALQWLLRMTGPDSIHKGDGEVVIEGARHRYHRMVGSPPDTEWIREIVALRMKKPAHNLVCLAMFEPGKARNWLTKALRVFEGVRVLSIEPGSAATREAHFPDLSSPESTFQSVLAAALARDQESFLDCFAEGSTRRSMARALKERPDEFWDRLNGALRPPQELSITRRGRTMVSARVHAPEADRGGVGGLTFVLVEEGWKIKGW